MTRREVEQLRRRIIQLFQERMRALEADRERALQATDDLLSSLRDDESEPLLPLFQEVTEPMTLVNAVCKIIHEYSGSFDINRIRDIVEAEYPGVKRPLNPTSISNTLKRLHKSGTLVRTFDGQGRIPAIYELSKKAISSNNHTEEEEFDDLPVPASHE